MSISAKISVYAELGMSLKSFKRNLTLLNLRRIYSAAFNMTLGCSG